MTSNTGNKRERNIRLTNEEVGRIYTHFSPKGRGIDPYRTEGGFYWLMENGQRDWCDGVMKNRDFSTYKAKADFLMGCPPAGEFCECLSHAMCLVNDIYIVTTIDNVLTRENLDVMVNHNFALKEVFVLKGEGNGYSTFSDVCAVWFSKNKEASCVKFDAGTIYQPILNIVV